MSISKREPATGAATSKTPSTAIPRRVRLSASCRSVAVSPGRYARSQVLSMFTRTAPSCELLQKPHIPREQQADVADAVLHHRDAVQAHAEGEAGDLIRVVGGLLFPYEAEDRGVHHAAAEQFNPAGVLALAAAL